MNAIAKPAGSIDMISRFGRVVVDLLGVAPDATTAAVLRARYGLCGILAAVDRIVTSHEVELIAALMDRDRLSLASRAIAVAAFEDGRGRRMDTMQAVADVIAAARDGRADAAQVLDDLIAVAASDGRIRRSERGWLLAICACMNMDGEGLDRRISALHPQAIAA
jgi:tellurite resistance protein